MVPSLAAVLLLTTSWILGQHPPSSTPATRTHTPGMNRITCKLVNYADPAQGQNLVRLLNAYAMDPLGGGTPLTETVQKNLPSRLGAVPHAFSYIAYCGEENGDTGTPAGLINCFEAFSTFACRPLVNVHDVFVLDEFRGQGVSQALLKAVEQEAQKRGCCKLTLECLSKNQIALKAYEKSGFGSYELNPEHGVALFLEKKLY
ncbi:Acetyltransferase [Seminavis robusta]|uniref:Acetyltransferase n=1 Tax=Seminavis robusta TaxID=568900 RepID=A0A9N8EKU3_9STRA|nr:Acetyltransferase [Seminavis robusta]|eukprot:Sro1129_g244400.1 Acetyltransferase (203) ;mRNA; f:27163-27771